MMIIAFLAASFVSAYTDAEEGMRIAGAESIPIAYAWPVKKPRTGLSSDQALRDIVHDVPFVSIDILRGAGEPGPSIMVSTVGSTGERIINRFIRQDPRYAAIIDADWVVVMPTRAVDDARYPLNIIMNHFAVKNVNPEELASAVHLQLKIATGREIFFRFQETDLYGGCQGFEPLALDLSSRTVRSILLEGVMQRGCSLEFSVTQEDGRTVVSFTPRPLPMSWYSLKPKFGSYDTPHRVQVPPSAIRVLERRHREGLATPEWRP